MNDIYDADLFELQSFHILEYDENKTPFRWTDGLFKIIQNWTNILGIKSPAQTETKENEKKFVFANIP